MAWSGFAEFARWWILLSRRSKYDPDRGGHHELWLSCGGSAGHSSLLAVNIDEGTQETQGGRYWETDVLTPAQARSAAAETSEGDAERVEDEKAARRRQRNREKVLTALRDVGADGETKSKIRDESGVNKGLDSIIKDLLEDGKIEACDVTKNHSSYSGLRLRSDNSDKAISLSCPGGGRTTPP